jgi:hypothetical protein
LQIKERLVTFIPTGLNDKISVRYSILVKQMTISKDEYNFWKKLQSSTEDVGDIFGNQPFSIKGNILNITDNKEPVLGYFQVASVESKRFYINHSELFGMDLPDFITSKYCELYEATVDGYYKSVYDIYNKLVLNGIYKIFAPIYDFAGIEVVGLILSPRECSDCTYTGSNKKPPFWQD